MRSVLLFVFIILASLNLRAQEMQLSERAQIALLTCSPGEELYSLFGHSAMHVFDPANGLNHVYNYGTFSFDDDFYYNFSMGKLNYRLSRQKLQNFMLEYQYYERGVYRQELDLTQEQKQKVFDFLQWNYMPENRYYLYDFFYDNCSSILRDVLEKNLGDEVEFADLSKEGDPSYRNMIDEYLIYHPWGDFGIDLGLGLPCDKIPNSREYMFLPYELMDAYDHATIDGRPLVKSTKTMLEEKGLETSWSLTNPIPLFWLLFGLVGIVTAIGWRQGKRYVAVDIVLFVVIGAVGALIFFLWFITDHTATAGNLNILWAWPTHILAIPLLFMPKARKFYFTAYGGVLLVTLIAFPFLPQMLHTATIPLMLMMLSRAAINIRPLVEHN